MNIAAMRKYELTFFRWHCKRSARQHWQIAAPRNRDAKGHKAAVGLSEGEKSNERLKHQ